LSTGILGRLHAGAPNAQKTSTSSIAKEIPPYEVFTDEFDRVAHIAELVEKDRLEFVHAWMQKYRDSHLRDAGGFLQAIEDMSARIASQFDVSRLDPSETAVTILVDGSGSTRGNPARDMTFATIETCIALENLGVETSVLGYTTSTWKGGESRRKWLDDGRPIKPGRLCDLLHIVYKRADESIAASIDFLCAMACEETKKENVDGEALQWAAKLALKSERSHKILLNLTDGLWPVDDSTLSVNPETLLLGHLKTVADDIEHDGRIALSAVYLDLESHRWASRSTEEYAALKGRGQTIFPRDIMVQVKDEFSLMLAGVAEGVVLGIDRAAELDPRLAIRQGW